MTKKFFYQLKIERPEADNSFEKWYTVWFDIIEADSKTEVRKQLEAEHNAVIAEKISSKTTKKIDYRVFIVELSPYWEEHWLTVRTCKICGATYDMLNAKRNGEMANHEACSTACGMVHRRAHDFGDYTTSYGNHRPCIYKIAHKTSGLVYIGQTTQCFTLRWYQHFYNTGDTKFHKAIKTSQPTDWTFEVLEVIYEKPTKDLLNEREQAWITKYNSIEAGLNTATASVKNAEQDQKQGDMDNLQAPKLGKV